MNRWAVTVSGAVCAAAHAAGKIRREICGQRAAPATPQSVAIKPDVRSSRAFIDRTSSGQRVPEIGLTPAQSRRRISISRHAFGQHFSALAILLAGLSLGFSACSAIESIDGASLMRHAKEQGAILAAAGFRIIPAQTEEQVAELRALPALKLNYYVGRGGQLHYWMADPYRCLCLFDGGEKAYLAYLDLKHKLAASKQQKEAAEEQLAFAQEEEMNLMSPFWFVPGAMFPVFAAVPGRWGVTNLRSGRGALGGGPGHGGVGRVGGFGGHGFGGGGFGGHGFGGIGGGFGGGHGGR